ncbi:MAG: PAS domain-containing sensor histidine kinase, partial [bacterium]
FLQRVDLEGEARFEAEVFRPDGSRLSVEFSARRLNGESIVWAARDITAQRRDDLAVREREKMLQALLQSTADCVMFVDPGFRIQFANPPLAALLKSAPNALVGKPLAEAFHGDVASALLPVFKTALETGNTQRVDTRLESALKAPVLAVLVSPVVIDRGASAGLVAIAHEVTIRPPSEEAMKDADRTLRELLESASAMFIGFTPFGKAALMNRAAERVTGYYRTEVLEKDFGRTLFPDELEHRVFLLKLQDITQGGAPGEPLENEIRDKSGEKKVIQWRLSPYRDRSRGLTCALAIGVDVTLRKLRDAQEAAQQELGTARSVLAGLAHDYNNILNIVLGYTSLTLGKTDPGTPVNDAIKNIQEAGQRAVALTQRLMEFSRRSAPPRIVLAVNVKVEAVVERLRKVLPSSIQIKTNLAPDAWPVEASPDELDTVLLNLCENARDAMPNQGTLTIETRNVEVDAAMVQGIPDARPGRFVAVTIYDTGVGITTENLPHIFEPFFSTKTGEGAGLGLSVAYGMIKSAGGWITASSVPGRGTQFA